MNRETRTFSVDLETRADGRKTIRGMPIVFNTLSEDLGGFREMVAPEAVIRALREDDIVGLLNHDKNEVLGRTSAGTMRLRAERGGVVMEIDPPDTESGRKALIGIERGDIKGGSFGFRALKDSWERRSGEDGSSYNLRVLRDIKIFDVGPVTFPAYPETSMAVRSLEEWQASEEVEPPTAAPSVPNPAAEAARARELDIMKATL